MSRLLAAEWLKVRKRWMPRVLVLIMVALVALIFWGIATSSTQRANLFIPRGWLISLVLSTGITSFLWPILAGSWAGNEYSWGTIRTVLSHRPDRPQFLFAGILAVLSIVGIALITSMLVGTVAGAIAAVATSNNVVDTSGLDTDFIGILLRTFFACWYALAFYVVVAYTAGTIFRSGAVGIGVGIGIIVAELVTRGILDALGGSWRSVADHFPTVYTNALVARVSNDGLKNNFNNVGSSQPGVVESLIALGIYIAVPLIVAVVLIRTRDVTS